MFYKHIVSCLICRGQRQAAVVFVGQNGRLYASQAAEVRYVIISYFIIMH